MKNLIWIAILVATGILVGSQVGRSSHQPECEKSGVVTMTTANGGIIMTSSEVCDG